ncbi:MAG: hypothetical protein M0R40_01295 [Firmicutes bacterium]|nr:hypothetical protein [Bacillota bacterium]
MSTRNSKKNIYENFAHPVYGNTSFRTTKPPIIDTFKRSAAINEGVVKNGASHVTLPPLVNNPLAMNLAARTDIERTQPMKYYGSPKEHQNKVGDIYKKQWYNANETNDVIKARDYGALVNNERYSLSSSGNYSSNNSLISKEVKTSVTQPKDRDEFGENSGTYKILVDLGNRWMSTDSQSNRDELHNTANEIRRLARNETPIKYAQDEVMNQLHINAQSAIDYQQSMKTGIMKFAHQIGEGSYFEDSVTFLIGMSYGDWNYKMQEEWRVPIYRFILGAIRY